MRTSHLPWSVALTISGCSLLALSGCGKRAGPTPGPTQAAATSPTPAPPAAAESTAQLTGRVTAPAGLLGEQPTAKPTSWFDGLLIHPAYAFAEVSFAAGISVGVFASDSFGVATGEAIAVAQTDASGYYAVALPEVYVADPSLVIQVGDAGDDGFRMRRMCTGMSYQDVSMDTEVGLQLVLVDTDTYPVDVRFIPATQYEVVYTTVRQDFVNYDVRPVLLRNPGHRREMFQNACTAVVVQVQARPVVWWSVRETVQSSYEVASVRGHGVMVVSRSGRAVSSRPPLREGRAVQIASQPLAVSERRAEQQRTFIAARVASQPVAANNGRRAEPLRMAPANGAAPPLRTNNSGARRQAPGNAAGRERPEPQAGGGKERSKPQAGGGREPSKPQAGGGKEPSRPQADGGGKKQSSPEAGGGKERSKPPAGGGKERSKPEPEGGKKQSAPEHGGDHKK